MAHHTSLGERAHRFRTWGADGVGVALSAARLRAELAVVVEVQPARANAAAAVRMAAAVCIGGSWQADTTSRRGCRRLVTPCSTCCLRFVGGTHPKASDVGLQPSPVRSAE